MTTTVDYRKPALERVLRPGFFKQNLLRFLSISLKRAASGRLWSCGKLSCFTSEQTSVMIRKVDVVEYTYVRVFHLRVWLRKVSNPSNLYFSMATRVKPVDNWPDRISHHFQACRGVRPAKCSCFLIFEDTQLFEMSISFSVSYDSPHSRVTGFFRRYEVFLCWSSVFVVASSYQAQTKSTQFPFEDWHHFG